MAWKKNEIDNKRAAPLAPDSVFDCITKPLHDRRNSNAPPFLEMTLFLRKTELLKKSAGGTDFHNRTFSGKGSRHLTAEGRIVAPYSTETFARPEKRLCSNESFCVRDRSTYIFISFFLRLSFLVFFFLRLVQPRKGCSAELSSCRHSQEHRRTDRLGLLRHLLRRPSCGPKSWMQECS